MGSLRATAACIGVDGSFSVMKDFFGLGAGKLPNFSGAPTSLSLLDQMRALKGKHFHVNMILVGSDLFTAAEAAGMDYAVLKSRTIYKQADMTVGRIKYFAITVAEANGREIIDNDSEAAKLTDEWTVHNNALDVFVVRDYTGTTLGRSAVNGSCDKDSTVKMSGSVVEISAISSGGVDQFARTFSHEMGHYLGLSHQNGDPKNLMCQSQFASNIVTSVELTSPSQTTTVRGHCFVQPGC
jgi:hypothetical protein